jgi:isopentenyl-diphosphate Delta-isomerase
MAAPRGRTRRDPTGTGRKPAPPGKASDAAAAARLVEQRKEEHLRIPLERDVQSIPSPWDAIRLRHDAVPELDRDEVRLATTFLGRRLAAPLQVTGMTGGARKAKEFNARLAAAAAEHGIAMGVGSQRAALANPDLADTYTVILDHDVPLRIANLGLPQLILWGDDAVDRAREAVAMVKAHALAIHLNYLQEAVQPEGDTQAKGGLAAVARVAKALKVPIVAKETGAGIGGHAASRLAKAGVAALDVGGLGGTSFSAVEHWRAVDQGDEAKARLGRTFWDWGIPTPACVRECRAACPDLPIVATGGLRTGLDAARALALGADVAGFAGHLFRAAAQGPRGAAREVGFLLEELKTALFLAGVRAPSELTEDHLR